MHGGGFGGGGCGGLTAYNPSANLDLPAPVSVVLAVVPSALPPLAPLSAAYDLTKIGLKIYHACQQSPDKNAINTLLAEFAKRSLSTIAETEASRFAKAIRLAAEATGVINELSTNTPIDAGVYGSMLEGTIKEVISSGINNLASYVVDDIMD